MAFTQSSTDSIRRSAAGLKAADDVLGPGDEVWVRVTGLMRHFTRPETIVGNDFASGTVLDIGARRVCVLLDAPLVDGSCIVEFDPRECVLVPGSGNHHFSRACRAARGEDLDARSTGAMATWLAGRADTPFDPSHGRRNPRGPRGPRGPG